MPRAVPHSHRSGRLTGRDSGSPSLGHRARTSSPAPSPPGAASWDPCVLHIPTVNMLNHFATRQAQRKPQTSQLPGALLLYPSHRLCHHVPSKAAPYPTPQGPFPGQQPPSLPPSFPRCGRGSDLWPPAETPQQQVTSSPRLPQAHPTSRLHCGHPRRSSVSYTLDTTRCLRPRERSDGLRAHPRGGGRGTSPGFPSA